MRLTPDQQSAIRTTVAENFGDEASIWLFGSRVDDNKRGGDIYHCQANRHPLMSNDIPLLQLQDAWRQCERHIYHSRKLLNVRI